ncbi:MAG: elongation factor P [Candidatus Omnitrophica bacterium]|nr:elongation factor P [Candidatus Omnitrophota bacterium]
MGLSINEIKAGVTIKVENNLFMVLDTVHVKPAKGSAFVRAKIRNLRNSNVIEMTFRGVEEIEEAFIEEKKLQYSYSSGNMYHFMDQETFEEVSISKEAMGDKALYLKDNSEVTAYSFKDEILNINLPNFIEAVVTHTEPGIKGDTAKGGNKPATIEGGATVQVPLFVNIGDKIKIDTRTAQYIERVY